jgi:hypothetical protein
MYPPLKLKFSLHSTQETLLRNGARFLIFFCIRSLGWINYRPKESRAEKDHRDYV